MAGFYNDKVIDHFKNPRNVGVIKNPDLWDMLGSLRGASTPNSI
jgi:NifU-like protein involved in Fe-S cluster formation